jgi:CIC family chloride channel protein
MLVVLSVTCGLMSRWTLRLIEASRRALVEIPDGLRPGFAGLLAGTLVLAVLLGAQRLAGEGSQPALVVASLGEGYGILRLAAGGIYPLWTLLLLMLALRIATTALAQGSSSAVGAFAPAMVIGAATGLATGSLASWSGIYQGSPVPMALAGMTAFFAASFRSPLASVVMIAEVSQGYAMLPALMLASAIGYLSGPDPGWIHTQKKARGSRD